MTLTRPQSSLSLSYEYLREKRGSPRGDGKDDSLRFQVDPVSLDSVGTEKTTGDESGGDPKRLTPGPWTPTTDRVH